MPVAALARDVVGAVAGAELDRSSVAELRPDPALEHVDELLVVLHDPVLHRGAGQERREQRLHLLRPLRRQHLDVDSLGGVVDDRAVVGADDDRVGVARLRDQVGDP